MTRAAVDSALVHQARSIIDRGSKSFGAASRLFSPAMRADVTLLYTWCRHCDDVTDGQELGQGMISTASAEALRELREMSLAAVAGQPSDALPFRALAEVSARHPINRPLVEAHIRGFDLDVQRWQPVTLRDTLQYCYHVAGVVGIMMARIMGVHDTSTLHRASDLGIAFQLTNIARDVVEDALAGRSYIPEEWRSEAGLSIDDLARPSRHQDVFPLVRRLIDEAEPYYESASIGIRALPRRAAWAVATARTVYRDIGLQIVRRGPVVLSDRVYTSQSRKILRMASSVPDALAPRRSHIAIARSGLWTPPEIVQARTEGQYP